MILLQKVKRLSRDFARKGRGLRFSKSRRCLRLPVAEDRVLVALPCKVSLKAGLGDLME